MATLTKVKDKAKAPEKLPPMTAEERTAMRRNPFRLEPNRPVSRGVWATGGKLPLATLTEDVTVFRPAFKGTVEFKREGTTTAYDFPAETLRLAKGSPVRVVSIAGGIMAQVIPGDFGVRMPGAPRADVVDVPLDALV